MNMLKHFTWIENNVINYNKINSIIKQHNGITTKDLVASYNEETNIKCSDPLTIETFNHIVKTTQRYNNTFYNVLNIIYNEETKKWLMKDEGNDELSRLKKENKKMKAALDNLTTIFED